VIEIDAHGGGSAEFQNSGGRGAGSRNGGANLL